MFFQAASLQATKSHGRLALINLKDVLKLICIKAQINETGTVYTILGM